MTYKLLIVDDDTPNIRLLERVFRKDYSCLTASSAEEAILLLDQHEVAVIITDQRMPQMTGLELLKKSADRRPHMVRILLTGYTDLEALVEAVNCGLVYMYVSKPWNNDDLKLRVGRAVEHYENNKRQHQLAATNERLTARLKEMKLGFVKAMASLLNLQDEYLYAHAARVSRYAGLLGERLGLHPDVILDVSVAAFLQDLDMQADRTAQIISCIADLKDAHDAVRYYNENFDGSGAPLGLIGEQIPLTARVVRVAKEFGRLTYPRNPGTALTPAEAIEQLKFGTGREFDPQVVLMLSDLTPEFEHASTFPCTALASALESTANGGRPDR